MDFLIDTIFVVFGDMMLQQTTYNQIKVETWKQKHETAKWNYLTLLSCENAETIVSY
jgi:hypothetical protein